VVRVSDRIVIKPSWREYVAEPGEVLIELDPGQAFGTGLHPSTQVCLLALESLVHPGAEVLDLGTGSGILAIAAARLGAKRVLAVDSDPIAIKVARANVVANGVGGTVEVMRGSLAEASGSYDVVVVNILLGAILTMLREGLATRARPGGSIVLAGILAEQEPQILQTARPTGLAVEERWVSGDWIGLALRPARPPNP
jgi:ribosomal protein L11 methyltransferase